MISICIPVYNFEVSALVRSLSLQAAELKVPFEILVVDDASDDSYKIKNRIIQGYQGVRYAELPQNAGRAKVRNILASFTAYPWIIFMDCDSALPDDQYLKRYHSVCRDKVVVFGGRTYEKTPPPVPQYFRWFYGIHRESKPALERAKHSNRSFMTNNFLISRDLMLSMPFDESFTTYGHEDTLMGYHLKKAGIVIQHIENPLIHLGLESAEDFMSKTEKGLDNLLFIYARFSADKDFINDVRVLKMFYLSILSGLSFVIVPLFGKFRNRMKNNLTGKKPSLFVFDLYKLGYLCSIYDKAVSKK